MPLSSLKGASPERHTGASPPPCQHSALSMSLLCIMELCEELFAWTKECPTHYTLVMMIEWCHGHTCALAHDPDFQRCRGKAQDSLQPPLLLGRLPMAMLHFPAPHN